MDFACLPELLLPWYDREKRELPWRKDRDPYRVWVSEIMLQQTRVEAVQVAYLRFLAELPTVLDLANCPEDRLRKLWEGLGYYSRVRNMKCAAQIIVDQYHGTFPTSAGALRTLPGIGEYTAGAIASICFEQPDPAVDGNVVRVLSRLEEWREDVASTAYRHTLTERLGKIYPTGRCGNFTQSLMELGAIVCLPNGTPHCERCPLSALCRSREGEQWREIPARAEKKPRRKEKLTVLLLRCGQRTALRKRPEVGLLAGMWELPNLPGNLSEAEALHHADAWGCLPLDGITRINKTHIFTHVEWDMTGYRIRCERMPEGFVWADEEEIRGEYSLPTAFRQFFGKKGER